MKKTLLFLILALGFSLRIIGADWGFPLLLHPDEHIIADVPADMAERYSCDPALYARPDHIEIYLNAALFHIAGFVRYGRPLQETFNSHKTFYYLLSRIFVALLGTACILLAYLIGKQYSERTGIIASALFAFFPSYVGHSHYITADIPLTLCVMLTIFFAVTYLKKPSHVKFILLCAAPALGLSVKYPGVLVGALTIIVIVYTHYADPKKMVFALAKALAIFLFFAFIFSPYLFINYQQVIQAVLLEARPVHPGADGLGWLGNMRYYLESYVSFSGMVMLFFFLAGVFYVIRNEKIYALPLFFGFLYWVLLSGVALHWERWALPMYTAPLLLAAYGADSVYKASVSSANKYAAPICSFAFLIIFFKLLVVSAVTTAMFTLNDTRLVSYQFVNEAGINEENALYEGYTPLSPGYPRRIETTPDAVAGKKFVILSSYSYKRFLEEKDRYRSHNQFYQGIFSLPLLREFSPVFDEDFADLSFLPKKSLRKGVSFLAAYWQNKSELLSGPTIRVYRMNGF